LSGGAVIKESTGLQPLSSTAGIFLIFHFDIPATFIEFVTFFISSFVFL
jgi:hypothetical protein